MALAYGLVVTVAFTNRAAVPFWSNTEHLRFVQIKKKSTFTKFIWADRSFFFKFGEDD
jgi:hypothetical protein